MTKRSPHLPLQTLLLLLPPLWLAAACTTGVDEPLAAGAAWFQMDDAAPESDELAGYVLRAGRIGAPEVRVALPPEAFAAGPFERPDGSAVVLFGHNDGARSRVEWIDVDTGARRALVESPEVLRRATLAGDVLYVHALRQDTRDELGVFRFDVTAVQLTVAQLSDGALALEGLPRDDTEVFGPTFGTGLWPTVGGGLIVQTCGELLCRARVLDPAGRVTVRDEIGQGELVGVTATSLIAWQAGNGWPSKLLSIDIATGQASEVAFAYGAALVDDDDGAPALVYDSGDAPGTLLRDALDGTPPRTLAVFGDDDELHPVPHAELSLAGIALPRGHALVGGDGRLAVPGGAPQAYLVRLDDGALFTTTTTTTTDATQE